jgi:hypothetical protein
MGFSIANWRCIVCPKVGKQIAINQLINITRLGASFEVEFEPIKC